MAALDRHKTNIMLQAFVKKILQNQEAVFEVLKSRLPADFNDQHIIDLLQVAEQRSLLANSAIADRAADYFQLLRERENYSQIPLNDIAAIYTALLDAHPMDLSLLEATFLFYRDVLDDERSAFNILNERMTAITDKLATLQSFME